TVSKLRTNSSVATAASWIK
ncbi:GHMP kinase N terminal domain protein, partial [Vibrio parahaemolyticus AQ3810]